MRTFLPGDRIDAVSAMKWTPQKTITSASVSAASSREPERVAHEVGHVLDLGHLVVVGEDHGVALGGERANLLRQPPDDIRGEGLRWRCLECRQLMHPGTRSAAAVAAAGN